VLQKESALSGDTEREVSTAGFVNTCANSQEFDMVDTPALLQLESNV